MLQTLFPMATGTHDLNNRLLVEKQEERSQPERLGDFQLHHTRLKTRASVFLCVWRHSQSWKRSPTHTQTHTHWCTEAQTGANPRLLSTTIVIVFACLHTSIIYFQMKPGQKHGRKCCVTICICIHVNTWLTTIYYVSSMGQAHS